jgi:drug/metabolite transporter (DMT)-like permease
MDYGDSTALISLVPVFAALFSRMLWKEKVSIYTLVALVVGIAGMVLIARPSVIFGVPNDSEKKDYSPFFPLVPISASLMLGFAYSLMRKVGTEVSPLFVSIFVFVNSVVDGIIFQFIVDDEFVLPGCSVDRGILFAGGLCLFLGLICLNRGLTLEKSGPGVLMKNCDIVVAYIIQIIFFHSVPNVTSIVGALLVLSSIVLVTVEKLLFKRCRFEI